jgi:hypothetical protein
MVTESLIDVKVAFEWSYHYKHLSLSNDPLTYRRIIKKTISINTEIGGIRVE